MQAGAQVAQMPMIAPIADEVMKGAGYQAPNPIGNDPNFPTVSQATATNMQMVGELPKAQDNTSPAYPPVPKDASNPMQGIETPNVAVICNSPELGFVPALIWLDDELEN